MNKILFQIFYYYYYSYITKAILSIGYLKKKNYVMPTLKEKIKTNVYLLESRLN